METRPTLIIRDQRTGKKREFKARETKVLVGRDASCHVILEDKDVSRHHAEISFESGEIFLRDFKSENRTFLNGIPLAPEEKTLLKTRDKIRIGQHEMFFLSSSPDESDFFEITDSDILEVKMVKKLLKVLDQDGVPSLEVIEGPETGQRFRLTGKRQDITIGRGATCEFRIDADVISRRHARVHRRWDSVEIEDLGSRNGTFVGSERVKKKILKDGDRIHLGTLVLLFRNPQQLPLEKLTEKEKGPVPSEPSSPPPKTEISPTEEPEELTPLPRSDLILILLGAAVLLGAVWAILKIL